MESDIKPPKARSDNGVEKPKAKIPPKAEPNPTILPEVVEPQDDNPVDLDAVSVKEGGAGRLAFLGKLFSSKRNIALTCLGALLFCGAVTTAYFVVIREPAKAPMAEKKVAPVVVPKPVVYVSPLTGVEVKDQALTKRTATAIMIENSPDARPQSGLRDAGVVYEAIAEGGITRFLTIFQEAQPQYIGPVRSIRPYYLDWAAPFDTPVAHVGGSLDALQQIRSGSAGLRDLDQFANASTYTRITQRYAPHNVYTSFAKLDALNQKKGFTTSTFTGWERKKAKPIAVPTAKSIDFKISSFYFNVHYEYDPLTNTYMRSEGGKAHVDILSADDKAPAQLHPNVVIATVIPYSYGAANDGYRSTYSVNGTGKAYVFQDGDVVVGTWTKADRKSQMIFKDSTGAVIKLNPGQTWVSVVSDAPSVTYKP